MPAIIAVPKSTKALMPCSHPSPATEWEKRPSATWSTVTPNTISAHLMPPGTLAKNELIKKSSEITEMTKMPPVPPDNQSPKGPGSQPKVSNDPKPNDRPQNLGEQGRQGNIKQNTTPSR